MRSDQKVAPSNACFTIWVFCDPAYRKPLVLVTNLPVSAEAAFCLYLDRWPVEQIPQVTKPLLGLERQWVFAQGSLWRLPELALLAANILLYLSAVLPPMPTGFWDRVPQRSPGRLQRVLAKEGFPKDFPLDERIREKRSVTAHLPKGIKAHRRLTPERSIGLRRTMCHRGHNIADVTQYAPGSGVWLCTATRCNDLGKPGPWPFAQG